MPILSLFRYVCDGCSEVMEPPEQIVHPHEAVPVPSGLPRGWERTERGLLCGSCLAPVFIRTEPVPVWS